MEIKELYKVNVETLQEFYAIEREIFKLEEVNSIPHKLAEECQLKLEDYEAIGVGLTKGHDDRFTESCLVLHCKEGDSKHVPVTKEDMYLGVLSIHVELTRQVWRALCDQPDWFRYWVVAYLQNRMADNFNYVERIEPLMIEDSDVVFTGITPAKVATSIAKDHRIYVNAIKRTDYHQCASEATFNIRANELIPFVVAGNVYGFNQVIPMSHSIELTKEGITYEAIEAVGTEHYAHA